MKIWTAARKSALRVIKIPATARKHRISDSAARKTLRIVTTAKAAAIATMANTQKAISNAILLPFYVFLFK